ncbi:large having a MATH plus UBC hydrolase plus type I pseurousyn plus hexapeptide [Cryptosporidium sp. chipmunk genotype I]|uniref:large having a MATH plus UBC hydrolase plus type I pseurousyn plus hexapeptide n=1 Tax=Cryptosporidium sp. chipmunk genotype I TaxID=1280935 RepID=UPI00351AA88D|nr:large having a MATH plus UBC hydrolase plus type I pseurousyn plus hexapeptide [Cryptosporidium sp. chipmunk genotype I]
MVRNGDQGHLDISSADKSEKWGLKQKDEEIPIRKVVEESSLEYYERSSRLASHFGKVYNGLYPVGPRLPSFSSSNKRSRLQSTYNEDEFSSSSANSSVINSDDKMYIDFPIRNFWKIAKTPIDMESPQIGYCRGFYYRLLVHPRGGSCNDSESSYLSVFLEALYHESYPDDWIFPNVRFQLSVVNFLDPKANITSWAHWTFSHDAMSRGWHKMVSHVRLTRAAGFVDEEGTVLIRGRAEPPFPRIWSRSPKCRPWSIWGTLPYRNASALAQYKPCITGARQEQNQGCSNHHTITNLCAFHELAENSNRGLLSCRTESLSPESCGLSQHQLEGSLLVGSTPLSIMDRLLWSSSNLFVPTLRSQLNVDFVPAFVHLLYHIKEFRRAIFSWNPRILKKCSTQNSNSSERSKRPDSTHSLISIIDSQQPQTSIIEALQKTFAYMTLWPIAYSVKRSIRHGWQERIATDPSLVDDWCFSKCCKCGGEFDSYPRSPDLTDTSSPTSTGSGRHCTSDKSTPTQKPNSEERECFRCKLPPIPDCSWIMKALYMNDLQRIDVADPLMRFHCFIFGAIYLESAHAILQIAAHHRKSIPQNLKGSEKFVNLGVSEGKDEFERSDFPDGEYKEFREFEEKSAVTRKAKDQKQGQFQGQYQCQDQDEGQYQYHDHEQGQAQNRDMNISISSIFDLEEDLRVPTEFDNTCRVLFSSVAEDGGDCFSDYSTCCLRAKHIHSIPKAIEHYAHRFKRFPETLFIYFTPPKNAKKGELFDVPFRLEASFLLENSSINMNTGIGVVNQDFKGTKHTNHGQNSTQQEDIQPLISDQFQDEDGIDESVPDVKSKARSNKGAGGPDSGQNSRGLALDNDSALCLESNDEYSLEYVSEDGFDENQDVSIQSDSQDDTTGRRSEAKSPDSENFFGSSSQYMEKWYSLYGVVIKEGDASGGNSTRNVHQLLIRPEEDGPWFRICDGLVERLIPKIEFTEWKCHGGFFCAAAVYIAEDYIDSIAAGDVMADCDIKTINPKLYQDTLDLLKVSEEELQYIPSWVSTQVNTYGPNNVHLEIPSSEVDHLAMCVDIANVTVCDSTTCVFGHPLMDAGLSIDPYSLWMLVDYRWGWPLVNSYFQLQEPLIQPFSADPSVILSGRTILTPSAQKLLNSLAFESLRDAVPKFWGMLLDIMLGPDLDSKDLNAILQVVPHLRSLSANIFLEIYRLLEEFGISEESQNLLFSQSELYSSLEPNVDHCETDRDDRPDPDLELDQDQKHDKGCLKEYLKNNISIEDKLVPYNKVKRILYPSIPSHPSSFQHTQTQITPSYNIALNFINRLHVQLWPHLIHFIYELLPVAITIRLKRLLFKSSDDLLFDPRLTPEDLCARFLTESKFLLESSCCPLNLIRFCDNKQLLNAAINQVSAALDIHGSSSIASSCSLSCPTNRMIDRFALELGSSSFVVPILVYITQILLSGALHRVSSKLLPPGALSTWPTNSSNQESLSLAGIENPLSHKDSTPLKQTTGSKKRNSSNKSSSGTVSSNGSIVPNPLTEAIQHLQVNQVSFSHIDPYVFIPLHTFHAVSTPLLVSIIFEHDLIGRKSFASESLLCASRVLHVNRLATVRHLYSAMRKVLYQQFLDTKISSHLDTPDITPLETPQSKNNGDHNTTGGRQQSSGNNHVNRRNTTTHIPIPIECEGFDLSWMPSNPLDVFCLYSLRPDTEPTRKGRLKYTYMQPNDFLENHYYGPHKSNYVTHCDVAVLICVPPELKLQIPPGSQNSDQISKSSSSQTNTGPGTGPGIVGKTGTGMGAGAGESDLDCACLYTCPSHIAHSLVCQSSRMIEKTVPKIVSPLFKAKLIDPLWSSTKFPMNDDSVAPLLIFKWFDQTTLDITLLSASICEARKSLRDCIVSWVFPRARRMGLIPQNSSKETPNADDYTVLEECHIRVCQNVRRWTSSIKKINRTTGDVFIVQKRSSNLGSSQPLISDCPFISPFITAALSSNSYSSIVDDFPTSLSKDELLTIITSMNTKRINQLGIFNTPIKGVSGNNSPSILDLKKNNLERTWQVSASSIGDSKLAFSQFFDVLKHGDDSGDFLASQIEDLDIHSYQNSSCKISMEEISLIKSCTDQGNSSNQTEKGSNSITGVNYEITSMDLKSGITTTTIANANNSTVQNLNTSSTHNESSVVSSNAVVGGVAAAGGGSKKKKKASKKLPGIPSLQKSSIVKALNAQRRLESQSIKLVENDTADLSELRGRERDQDLDQDQDQDQDSHNYQYHEESKQDKRGEKHKGDKDKGEESGVKGSNLATASSKDANTSESMEKVSLDIKPDSSSSSVSTTLRPEKLQKVPDELFQIALESLSGDSFSISSIVSRLLERVIHKFTDISNRMRESSSLIPGVFSENSSRSEFLIWMNGLNDLISNLSLIGGSKKVDQILIQREIIQLLRRLLSGEPSSQQLSSVASESLSSILKSLEDGSLEPCLRLIISNIPQMGSGSLIFSESVSGSSGSVIPIPGLVSTIPKSGYIKKEPFSSYHNNMYNILIPVHQRSAILFTVLLIESLSILSPSSVIEMHLGLLPKTDYIRSNSLIKSTGYKSVKSFVLLAFFLSVFGVKDAMDIILSLQGVKGFENLLIRMASYTIGLRQYATSNFITENTEKLRGHPSLDWVSSLRITDKLAISEEVLKKTLEVICDHFSTKSNSAFAQNKKTLDLIQNVEGIVRFSDIDDFAYEEAQLLEMRKVAKDAPQVLVNNKDLCIVLKPPFWYCSIQGTSVEDEDEEEEDLEDDEEENYNDENDIEDEEKNEGRIRLRNKRGQKSHEDDEESNRDEKTGSGEGLKKKTVSSVMNEEENDSDSEGGKDNVREVKIIDGTTDGFEKILNSGKMESISDFFRLRCKGIGLGRGNKRIMKGLALKLGVEIGGPILVLKNEEVKEYYNKSETLTQVQCQYIFLCHGQIQNSSDKSVSLSNIVSNASNRIFSKCLSSDGGDSIAKFNVCEHIKFKNYNKGSPSTFSLCTCTSKPGNVNKIRAYMHQIGHTIVGDSKHLGQKQLSLDRRYFPNIFFYCTHLEIPIMQNNMEQDGDHEVKENRDDTVSDGNAIICKESIKVMVPVSRDIMELLENDFEITEKFSDMYFCNFYRTNSELEKAEKAPQIIASDADLEARIEDEAELNEPKATNVLFGDNIRPGNVNNSGINDNLNIRKGYRALEKRDLEPPSISNTLIASLPGLGFGLTPFLGMPNSQYAVSVNCSQDEKPLVCKQDQGSLSSSSGHTVMPPDSVNLSAPNPTSSTPASALHPKTNTGTFKSFGFGKNFLTSSFDNTASAGSIGEIGRVGGGIGNIGGIGSGMTVNNANLRHTSSQQNPTGGVSSGVGGGGGSSSNNSNSSLPIKTHPNLVSCLSELNSKSDGSGLGIGLNASSLGPGGGGIFHQNFISGTGLLGVGARTGTVTMGGVAGLTGAGAGVRVGVSPSSNFQHHSSSTAGAVSNGRYGGLTMSNGIGIDGNGTMGNNGVQMHPQQQQSPGVKHGWNTQGILQNTRWNSPEGNNDGFVGIGGVNRIGGLGGGGAGAGVAGGVLSEEMNVNQWNNVIGGNFRGINSRGMNNVGGLNLSTVNLVTGVGIGGNIGIGNIGGGHTGIVNVGGTGSTGGTGGSGLWGQHTGQQQPSIIVDPPSQGKHSPLPQQIGGIHNLVSNLHAKNMQDGIISQRFDTFSHERGDSEHLESRQTKKSQF